MSQRYTAQEREYFEELLKQEEQPKELRDYTKFEDRYREFLDEHKERIKFVLEDEYYKFVSETYYKIKYKECVTDIAVPMGLLLGLLSLLVTSMVSRIPRLIIGVVLVVVYILFLFYASYKVESYRENTWKALFRDHIRKTILADYVRREEKRTIDKLMLNNTIDSYYRKCQCWEIERFYEKCLKKLIETKFENIKY